MDFTKKIQSYAKKHPVSLLRIVLGLVFLSAGLQKAFFFQEAYENFLDLGINFITPLLIITISLQIIAGILLIINKYVVPAAFAIGLLLLVGVTMSILKAGYSLVENINELFILTYTPTNIFLHITYLIGVITILLVGIKENSEK
tara:strand:+ start:237 stop:671 length:435 start_codon:yes stop_codon:yes gene_type:complete